MDQLDNGDDMTTAANAKTLPQRQAPRAATPASVMAEINSLRRCERALDMLLTQRGDAFAEVERVLADDPGSVFCHCLRAALIVRAENGARRSALAASIAVIEAACPDINDPARRHAMAARAWLQGDSVHAAALYGAVLADRPHDVLALAVAHALDFHLGRRRVMRDRIARVLPKWGPAVPGYASVLAMFAFALEENGQYRRAEKIARRALGLDPRHPGAIHVIAHVMEMQGRAREGLAFLAATESTWAEGTGFSAHLAWHRALFHLETDDPVSAVAVYDNRIVHSGALGMSALADASALLWRLYLRNIDVNERWQALADRWEMQSFRGARPFYIVHAIMAFAASGRSVAAVRALRALPDAGTAGASRSIPEEALAPAFCNALLAFAHRSYKRSLEWLSRVRSIAHRCGGSIAQCDVVHLTFTEAALRIRNARLARALVAERSVQKPASRLNQLFERRIRGIALAPAQFAAAIRLPGD